MKRLGWPRPPVILGVVLGDIVERYMFISVERYGTEWIFPTSWANVRWVVLAMFALSIWGLMRPSDEGVSGGRCWGTAKAEPEQADCRYSERFLYLLYQPLWLHDVGSVHLEP